MSQRKASIFIISDATGETAATMVRAAIVHYPEVDITIHRSKNVRTETQLEAIMSDAEEAKAVVAHTMVSPQMRLRITEMAAARGLPSVDLMGPLLSTLDEQFGVSTEHQVGRLRLVDERYYRRIEAIEFTVKHDDGKCLSDLDKADIILVGVSRTSKTPLSVFLSHKGWRVANIPMVVESPLPTELFKVDQRKIVGLMIDMDTLSRIRRNRLEKFGQDPGGSYSSLEYIENEISYAQEVFRQNRKWPVFNVTERALEETAAEITRMVTTRMGIPDPL